MPEVFLFDAINLDDDFAVSCAIEPDVSVSMFLPKSEELIVLYEAVHTKPPRLPRGSLTPEELKRRRRERRQSPTAKVKESQGRKRREARKKALRERWYTCERKHRAFLQLCLANARTADERELCLHLLRASDAVVDRSRELCPKSAREQLNSIPPWCDPLQLMLSRL